jgi:hypothetical protein
LGRDAAEEEVCPAAILVGIDVSLEPGLTGMNFFGQGPASLLLEVDQILLEATNELRWGVPNELGWGLPILGVWHQLFSAPSV